MRNTLSDEGRGMTQELLKEAAREREILKGAGLLRQRCAMRFVFIRAHARISTALSLPQRVQADRALGERMCETPSGHRQRLVLRTA